MFVCLFLCLFSLNLKWKKCVWTALAWPDCMCDFPEGRLFSRIPIVFGVPFDSACLYTLFFDFGAILGVILGEGGAISAPVAGKAAS